MKTTINNIKISQGEVSIVMSDFCQDIVRHSCRTAKALRDRGVHTLVINCATSNGRFCSAAEAIIRPESYKGTTNLKIRSVVQGNLYGDRDNIDMITRQRRIMVVIICGWEWTSDSYRRKAALLSYLRGLMEEQNVAVIIYSQAQTNPAAGRCDRGGLGWIASLAIVIVRIEASGEPADVIPSPPMIVVSPDEWESAQLMVDKLMSYAEKNESPNTAPNYTTEGSMGK